MIDEGEDGWGNNPGRRGLAVLLLTAGLSPQPVVARPSARGSGRQLLIRPSSPSLMETGSYPRPFTIPGVPLLQSWLFELGLPETAMGSPRADDGRRARRRV
jgi:hypothetical protein